jgi:hypothetical protein
MATIVTADHSALFYRENAIPAPKEAMRKHDRAATGAIDAQMAEADAAAAELALRAGVKPATRAASDRVEPLRGSADRTSAALAAMLLEHGLPTSLIQAARDQPGLIP